MFRSITTRVAGLIILIAGLWGGLIPFVGPYFHFTLGPDHTWAWTSGRLYLDVLPAIAAVLGGLFLLGAGLGPTGRLGALLALAGGIWFAVGPDVSTLWHTGGAQGVAHGHKVRQMLEALTFHTGLGVLITAFAAYALPGLVVRRVAEPATVAAAGTGAAAAAPVGRRRFGFFGRRRAAAPAAAAGAGGAAAAPVGRRRFGFFGRRRPVAPREVAGPRDGAGAPAGAAPADGVAGDGAAAREPAEPVRR